MNRNPLTAAKSEVAYQKARNRSRELAPKFALLNNNEKLVLDRVLAGCMNKDTAEELGVTPRAVERIRARIVAKFEVDRAAQMIAIASEWRLLCNLLDINPDVGPQS